MLDKFLPYHKKVAHILNQILTGNLGVSSFLFIGFPGSGRDYIADILAKTLLCTKSDFFPCGECQSCLLWERSSHPDFRFFVEYKVENFRELKSKAYCSPLVSPKKVFLFSGAQNFNQSCANAILKILEEPPPYLVFILTADTSQELLPTILSRSLKIEVDFPSQDKNFDFIYYAGKEEADKVFEEMNSFLAGDYSEEKLWKWWIRWQNMQGELGEEKIKFYHLQWEVEYLLSKIAAWLFQEKVNYYLFTVFLFRLFQSFQAGEFWQKFDYFKPEVYFMEFFLEQLLEKALESDLLTIKHKQLIIDSILEAKEQLRFNVGKELILLRVLEKMRGAAYE